MSFKKSIKAPHIPLGVSFTEFCKSKEYLKFPMTFKERDDDKVEFYSTDNDGWNWGVFIKRDIIISSWYDDPFGRQSDEGIEKKINQYLSRYGSLDEWEARLNNGWIQFYFNDNAGINMAYGIHQDVIRFNQIQK